MEKRHIHSLSNSLIGEVLKRCSKKNYKICLCYHGVQEDYHPACIRSSVFREQMQYISQYFKVVSLKYFISNIDVLEDNYVTVTFDDGYVNLIKNAFPILSDLGIPATVFLPINFIGKTNNWYPRCNYPYLKVVSLKQLYDIIHTFKNIYFGSHTFSHSNLSQLSDQQLMYEIRDSKLFLEEKLAQEIISIAYPYGTLVEIDKRASNFSKLAGYKCGLSTHFGRYNSQYDLFNIRRIVIWSSDNISSFKNKLAGNYDWLSFKEKLSFFRYNIRRNR